MNNSQIMLRLPQGTDGFQINSLIANCPPLDTNSTYCNLLQCTDFASTSIVAEQNEKIVGFISGYRPPERQDVLFIWQVAVDSDCRGQGVGQTMLVGLVDRLLSQGVRYLETTITEDNVASQALFKRFFQSMDVPSKTRVQFSRSEHFAGKHADEILHRGGPFRV